MCGVIVCKSLGKVFLYWKMPTERKYQPSSTFHFIIINIIIAHLMMVQKAEKEGGTGQQLM